MKNTITISKLLKQDLRNNTLNILFFLLTVVFIITGKTVGSTNPQIIFLDVGQGDAILLQDGNTQVLIDGGPDNEIIFKLSKYMPWFDNKIETIVITHPHDDHIVGIAELSKKYQIGEILYNPVKYDNQSYNYILEKYSDRLIPISKGYTFRTRNFHIDTIYPLNTNDYQETNINNESVILLANIINYKILLMGDAEGEVEEKISEQDDLEGIYILKIGHHCSRTSTSETFLRETLPSIAICSVGRENKFGHPHSETVEKLKRYKVQYLLTSQEGDIVINF